MKPKDLLGLILRGAIWGLCSLLGRLPRRGAHPFFVFTLSTTPTRSRQAEIAGASSPARPGKVIEKRADCVVSFEAPELCFHPSYRLAGVVSINFCKLMAR